ncbi:MAG: two-component system sensor histidine kinase NtrB [Thermoanaerobaculia bacterium]
MVPIASRGLTTVGFRRDIKFFLAALVGFLAAVIVVLLVVLQTFAARAETEVRNRWDVVSREAAGTIERIGATDHGSIETALIYIRGHYGLAAADVKLPDGSVVRSGATEGDLERVSRRAGTTELTVYFDAAEIRGHRRTFYAIAAISLLAAVLGTILLLLYLPRITAPIEAMLGDAKKLDGDDAEEPHDEAAYLIDTFRRSIETLQRQEAELKVLHEQEKTRADELQRVSATLTRSLTSGFLALDPAGTIRDLNAAGREILGFAADAPLAGQTLDAFGKRPFRGVMEEAFAKRSAVSRVEVEEMGGDASRVVGVTTVPLFDDAGAFAGMLALFADLTPVRELEARVRDMQTLAGLGEMAAGIAHEFRNSLSTILGYLRMARKQPLDDSVAAKLASAEEEAAQLNAAVEALLHFARPMRLDLHAFDLHETTESVVERLRRASPDVSIEVRGAPAGIEGDRQLVARLLENVLRNAIDAVRAKGAGGVRVSVTPGSVATVMVEDDGIGLDPADAPRYFLPFQSDKPGGFGIGLALARKIVLLHGGTMRLTGKPGEGATVVVELPEHPPASELR